MAMILTLTFTMRLPRSVGFFDIGMPCPGKLSCHVGGVGPACATFNCFPSIVFTVLDHPSKASFNGIESVMIRSSPSRTKYS